MKTLRERLEEKKVALQRWISKGGGPGGKWSRSFLPDELSEAVVDLDDKVTGMLKLIKVMDDQIRQLYEELLRMRRTGPDVNYYPESKGISSERPVLTRGISPDRPRKKR